MSDTSTERAAGRTSAIPMIFVVALLMGGLFLMTQFASANRDRAIDNSPVGISALAGWLTQNDVPARQSHRRVYPALEDLGLRVMPLYDLDLSRSIVLPTNQEDRLNSDELRDIEEDTYLTKVSELPTVVLLPKWRGAAAELEILHEQALIPTTALATLMNQLGLNGTRIDRAGPQFDTAQIEEQQVALFHAQTFAPETLPEHCTPDVLFEREALVIRCDPTLDALPFPIWFVADPDLLNNHGLAVADNARFGTDYLASLRSDPQKPIYVDTSPDLLTRLDVTDEGQTYERGGEELSRFLQYPFSVFWAMFLVVVAVTYWRGAFRFGPVLTADTPAWDQSKGAAIAAKSRLLRLSGNDGAIVADFVTEHLRTLSRDYLGHEHPDDGGKRFFQVLSRRDTPLANELSDVATRLTRDAHALTPAELNRLLKTYHALLKKVIDPHGSN